MRRLVSLLIILSILSFGFVFGLKKISKNTIEVCFNEKQIYVIDDIYRAGKLKFSRLPERADDDTDYFATFYCGDPENGGIKIADIKLSSYLYEQEKIVPIKLVYKPIYMVFRVHNNDPDRIMTYPFRLQFKTSVLKLYIGYQYVYVDDEPRWMEVAPYIEPPGRTMVPIRFIGEGFGAKVEWIPNGKKVNVYFRDITLRLQIGRKYMILEENGCTCPPKKIGLDVPPLIIHGRTMLPLRAVAEAIGFRVRWSDRDRMVELIPIE